MSSRLRALIVITLTLIIGTTARSSEGEKQYLGIFSNVVISSMSGDCGGISLKLWKFKDFTGRSRITGFYYDASSTCNGEPVPIADASYDEKTGAIDLLAKDKDSDFVVAELRGEIKRTYLVGTFGFGSLGTKEVGSGSQVKLRRLNSRDWKRVGGK